MGELVLLYLSVAWRMAIGGGWRLIRGLYIKTRNLFEKRGCWDQLNL